MYDSEVGLAPWLTGAAPLLCPSPPKLHIPGLGQAAPPPPKSIPRTHWAWFLRIGLSGWPGGGGLPAAHLSKTRLISP